MADLNNDPYKILGVTKTATQDEIRNSYRALAKKLHPDLNPGNKEAERKFKDINAAYELLGTPEARKKFETEGQEKAAYEEAVQAAQARARQGRGGGPYYYETQQSGGRYSQNFADGGFNSDDLFESLFKQYGQQQSSGGRAGPSQPQPSGDIEAEIAVGLAEAVLGGEVQVQLPDGPVKLKIPVGVNNGSKLRLRGKGSGASGKKGDLIVSIRIELPKKIDPELKEAIQKWAAKTKGKPNAA